MSPTKQNMFPRPGGHLDSDDYQLFLDLAYDFLPEDQRIVLLGDSDDWRGWDAFRPALLADAHSVAARGLPDHISAWAMNRYVGRALEDKTINAQAVARENSTAVILSQALIDLMAGHVSLLRQFEQAFREIGRQRGPLGFMAAEDGRHLVEELSDEVFSKLRDDIDVSAWVNWYGQLTIGDKVPSVPKSERFSPSTIDFAAATAFVIAHELGHHLLGHTITSPHSAQLRAILEEERNVRLIDAPAGLTSDQTDELDCDLIALLSLSRAVISPPITTKDELGSWALAIDGAIHGLNSLDLVSRYSATSSNTHPPLNVRIDQVFAFAMSCEFSDDWKGSSAEQAAITGGAHRAWAFRHFLRRLEGRE